MDVITTQSGSLEHVPVRPCLLGSNPLVKAIAKGGPLATAFKRKQYYKEKLKVVEAVEYELEAKSNKTFQYVPLLKSLQQLLARKDIVDKLVDNRITSYSNVNQYVSFQDGEHHKKKRILVKI